MRIVVAVGLFAAAVLPWAPGRGRAQPGQAEAKARFESAGDLRMFWLGLQGFEDEYGSLPPADGSAPPERVPAKLKNLAGLSWRSYMVDRLSSDRNKAADIAVLQKWHDGKLPAPKPGEKWNQPELVNIRLAPFSSFPPGKTKEAWHTFYRVFVGPGAAFEKARLTKLTPADFPDGLENTLLVVEAGDAVPWPKPEELEFTAAGPLPKLGGVYPDGAYALFADNAVRFIRRDTDPKLLRAWVTRNGGEKVALPPRVDFEAMRRAAGYE